MEITQVESVDAITIKVALWEVDLSKDDVTEMYHDIVFLQNAVLTLLNPKVCDKSDMPHKYEATKELLKDYFLKERDLNYNQEFLQSVFK